MGDSVVKRHAHQWARRFAEPNHRWVVGGTVTVIGLAVIAIGFAAKDDHLVNQQVVSRSGTASWVFWVVGGLLTLAGIAVLTLPPRLLPRTTTITVLAQDNYAHSVMAQLYNVGAAVVRLPEVVVENPPHRASVTLVLRLKFPGDYGGEALVAHNYLPRLVGTASLSVPFPKPDWYDSCEYAPIVVSGGETKVFGVAFPLISVAKDDASGMVPLTLEVEDILTGRKVDLPGAVGKSVEL